MHRSHGAQQVQVKHTRPPALSTHSSSVLQECRGSTRCVAARQVFVPNEAPYVKIVLIVLVLFAAIVLQVSRVHRSAVQSRVEGSDRVRLVP
jgi:hypothetical protein